MDNRLGYIIIIFPHYDLFSKLPNNNFVGLFLQGYRLYCSLTTLPLTNSLEPINNSINLNGSNQIIFLIIKHFFN